MPTDAKKYLSKVKIGEVVYDLKDASARADLATLVGTHAVEALGTAAWYAADSSVAEGATGIATTAAVKSYVDAQVGAIHNFDVKIYEAKGGEGADKNEPKTPASADTMYILALVQDADAEAGTYVEYITVRSGAEGAYTYAWEKIGSTKTDLSGYVKKTQTIAGVDLQDDITAAELQTALGLKAMAYAATASGSVSGQTISGVTASYTPAGNVTLTSAEDGSFQVAGSVSKPDIDVTPGTDVFVKSLKAGDTDAATFTEGVFTPASISDGFLSAGAQASFTQGTKASLTDAQTDTFAKAGLVAEIDKDDAEMLVFSTAATASAVTDRGTFTANGDDSFTANTLQTIDTTKFSGGSKAADTFSANKLPVVDATAAPTVTAALKNAPVFTGSKYNPAFSGTAGTADVADITVAAKDVTVSPDAE